MIFYKIELLGIPEFIFCCSVSVKNYSNQFIHRKNFIEISIVESGRVLFEEDGRREVVQPETLTVFSEDTNCKTSAYNNETQSHSTVGVNVPYRFTRYNSDDCIDIKKLKEELSGGNTFLLPKRLKMSSADSRTAAARIKKITALYNSYRQSDKIRAKAGWYTLCAFVSDIVLSELDNSYIFLSPSAHIYTKKAQDYIFEHYRESFSVSDIAERLGISEGYMQRIFKSVTGKSIITFTNEYRVKTAAEIIKIRPMKLSEIAYQVGIEDTAYMSRIFKKYMGMSYSEYSELLTSKADAL